MTAILASVANSHEAQMVFDCGVRWIDIKDPSQGALGAASPEIITEVVSAMKDEIVTLSATAGDSWFCPEDIPERVRGLSNCGVDYAKVAVSARYLTRKALQLISDAASQHPTIIVCMAENMPCHRDLMQIADSGVSGLMLDTMVKDGRRLMHHVPFEALAWFASMCRSCGLLCGLAGSLDVRDVPQLASAGADYLGFRSALCPGRQRQSPMSRAAVMEVRSAIGEVEYRVASAI